MGTQNLRGDTRKGKGKIERKKKVMALNFRKKIRLRHNSFMIGQSNIHILTINQKGMRKSKRRRAEESKKHKEQSENTSTRSQLCFANCTRGSLKRESPERKRFWREIERQREKRREKESLAEWVEIGECSF